MAVLVYTDIEGKRRLAKLKSGRNTIGRRTQNDIILNIATVSRHHASIILEGGQYLLNDAGSANGTKVNGVRVKGEIILEHKDVISLGECELILLVAEGPDTVPLDESTAGAEKSAAKSDVPEPLVDDDEGNGSEAPTAVPESHGTGAPIDAAEIDKPEAPSDIDLGEIDGPEDAPAPDPVQDDYDARAFFEEDEDELQTVETEAAKEEKPGGENKASDVRQRRPARRSSRRSERRSSRASQRKGPNYVAIASIIVSVGCALGIVALLSKPGAGKRPAKRPAKTHEVIRKNPALDFLGEAEKYQRQANEVITAEQQRRDQGLEYRKEELKKAEKHYQKAYDMFDEFNAKYPGEKYAGYRVEGKMREINIRLRFVRNELYILDMQRLREER